LQQLYHPIRQEHRLFSCNIFFRPQISVAIAFDNAELFKELYFFYVRIISPNFIQILSFILYFFEVIMSLDSAALLSLSLVLIKITHFYRNVRIQVKDATVKQSHFYFRTHKNDGLIESPGIHKQGL